MVGGPTAATLLANAVSPGLLERYLGARGVDSQQTGEAPGADRPANLFEPVDDDADYGAHGTFDDRSHAVSPRWWATRHRGTLLAVGAAAAWARLARTRRGIR